MEEFYSTISKMRKNRKWEDIIDRNEFVGWRSKILEEWIIYEERDLDNAFGDYESENNHEL